MAAHGNTTARGRPALVGPFPVPGAGAGRNQVIYLLRIRGYAEPGRYQSGAVQLGEVTVTSPRLMTYQRATPSTVDTTVNGDGSGSAAFSDFATTDGTPLSGQLRWMCEMGRA